MSEGGKDGRLEGEMSEIRIWERENGIKDKIYVVWAKIDLNESTLPYQPNPFLFLPERQGIL